MQNEERIMRALITGVAGFVGSNLAESLLAEGWEVTGVDAFTDYYDPAVKAANLTVARQHGRFRFVAGDLFAVDLAALVDGVDVVFHQAAQPGVRKSWGTSFDEYVRCNVAATQLLLETVTASRQRPRVVYASSSSVYGEAPAYPCTETDLPRPRSPYGVTKLAAEHLCRLYADNHGVHTVSLRYFTVYGPRQRPDMAFHRLCEAACGRGAFPLYGDGSQIRDFTFIADVVAANRAAATADVPAGTVVNIAGGSQVSMRQVIDLVGELVGHPPAMERHPGQPGDVRRTGGTTDAARALLGWEPQVGLRQGLEHQLDHHAATVRQAS